MYIYEDIYEVLENILIRGIIVVLLLELEVLYLAAYSSFPRSTRIAF